MADRPARFVWLRGDYGRPPRPERWPADAPVGCRDESRVLAAHRLGQADDGLTLDQLAARFPAPPAEET